VVQLYIYQQASRALRRVRQLRSLKRVTLQLGELRVLSFGFDEISLQY